MIVLQKIIRPNGEIEDNEIEIEDDYYVPPPPAPPPPEERIGELEQQASQYDQLIVDLTYSITLLELGVI